MEGGGGGGLKIERGVGMEVGVESKVEKRRSVVMLYFRSSR